MIDRPNASELLTAMADTLTREVMPSLNGAAKHSARVVANLCKILAREWNEGDGPPVDDLRDLLDSPDADYASLVAELDRRLADSSPETDELAAAALPIVMADVERRLAIDRPGYAQP